MNLSIIRTIVKAVPQVYPLLNDVTRRIVMKQFTDYHSLRADYWSRIYDSVNAYLNSDRAITLYRNSDQNLIADYFQYAAEIGWQDSGGSLPIDETLQSAVDSAIAEQQGFISDMFQHLRDDKIPDYIHEAFARADGYAGALDSIYNRGRMAGVGKKMLTWKLGATEKHCTTCLRLDGERHRASWFVSRGYIPQQPGNEKLECGGWNCDCKLVDDNGDEVTLSYDDMI